MERLADRERVIGRTLRCLHTFHCAMGSVTGTVQVMGCYILAPGARSRGMVGFRSNACIRVFRSMLRIILGPRVAAVCKKELATEAPSKENSPVPLERLGTVAR